MGTRCRAHARGGEVGDRACPWGKEVGGAEARSGISAAAGGRASAVRVDMGSERVDDGRGRGRRSPPSGGVRSLSSARARILAVRRLLEVSEAGAGPTVGIEWIVEGARAVRLGVSGGFRSGRWHRFGDNGALRFGRLRRRQGAGKESVLVAHEDEVLEGAPDADLESGIGLEVAAVGVLGILEDVVDGFLEAVDAETPPVVVGVLDGMKALGGGVFPDGLAGVEMGVELGGDAVEVLASVDLGVVLGSKLGDLAVDRGTGVVAFGDQVGATHEVGRVAVVDPGEAVVVGLASECEPLGVEIVEDFVGPVAGSVVLKDSPESVAGVADNGGERQRRVGGRRKCGRGVALGAPKEGFGGGGPIPVFRSFRVVEVTAVDDRVFAGG